MLLKLVNNGMEMAGDNLALSRNDFIIYFLRFLISCMYDQILLSSAFI